MIIEKVRYGDRGYPNRLISIPDPPKELYYTGSLPVEEQPAAAIIGARDCSEYGLTVAKNLGKVLGQNGVQIISGMARGIDGVSQKAAIDAGGRSFAVLGSGVDVCYPQSNQALYDRLPECGGIISEYAPGEKALAWHFPPRNRIVSGLADVLIVVEAREKSGTLITVDMALEQGKEVYIVPGRITDRLSDGCNRLLKMGAGVILNPEDFLKEVWNIDVRHNKCESLGLSKGETVVYKLLEHTPKGIEDIRGKLPVRYNQNDLYSDLLELCIKGIAAQVSPGHFCLIK